MSGQIVLGYYEEAQMAKNKKKYLLAARLYSYGNGEIL